MDKNLKVKKVVVMDKENVVQISMKFNKVDMKSKFKDNYFDLNKIIDTEEKTDKTKNTEKTKETMTIDDVIYPMYLPTNTYLADEETLDIENGQRLIMTFDGDSPFMLIEETVKQEDEHVIEPTFGEIEMLGNSVAVLNDNSINWYNNGMEYYLVSNTMKTNELVEVAKSISVLPVSK